MFNINYIISENIELKKRVKELEESCSNFVEVEINSQKKIKQLNLEIEDLRENLHYYIDKYGTNHELTIIKSQEVDSKLNILNYVTAGIVRL